MWNKRNTEINRTRSPSWTDRRDGTIENSELSALPVLQKAPQFIHEDIENINRKTKCV